MRRRRVILVKFGGELLESPPRLRRIARAVVQTATRGPVVVVHGGGREVDAELARHGVPKQAVDGLRVTDAATLEVVVAVLAGRVNTRFVAALNAVGASAVGLTGVDAGLVRVRRARRYRATDGSTVDLGFVGVPTGGHATMIRTLTRAGHIPVVASIAADRRGRVYNVNADTLAGDLAPRIGARELVIAGSTDGVLDAQGRSIPVVRDDVQGLARLIRDKEASAGMVAKLLACRDALRRGVGRVAIVDGRRQGFLDPGSSGGTRVIGPGTARSR